jgi:SAM-dependent methyltransferase
MRPDVIDLAHFYASHLGQVARRVIRRRIRSAWPDVTGLRVLGIGYAIPYLLPFREESERSIAVMPATQGVVHWPRGGKNKVVLSEERELPFPDESVDRVLLVHELENAEQIGPLLEEIWRILTPPGRLLVVVPNRRGLWARFESTPFGHGRPWSPPQLTRLLREADFSPAIVEPALFVPPGPWRMIVRAAPIFERLGRRWGLGLAGVLVVEAGKQVYAVTPQSRPQRQKRGRRATRPLPGGVTTRTTPDNS